MAADPNTPLGKLLTRLESWTPIPAFAAAMDAYFKSDRPEPEVAGMRAKSGVVKKLRDEVTPVLHHVKFVKAKGEVRFPLDNHVPDCWLRAGPNAAPQGIEVTCALAREQALLGQQMNKTRGIVAGFMGLPDEAPGAVYKERLAGGRLMHSTDGVLRAVRDGIKTCLCNKNDPKYAGHDLLIEAHLTILPKERWAHIEPELREAARAMPFREIHVIGDHDRLPFGFRIK